MKPQTLIAIGAMLVVIVGLLTLRSCNVISGQTVGQAQLAGVDTVVIPKPAENKHANAGRVVRLGSKGDTLHTSPAALAKDTACKPFIATSDTMTMYDRARIATTFYFPSCKFSTYYHPAPDTMLIRSYIQQQKTGWAIGAGFGYGAAPIDGNLKLVPSVHIGIYKTLLEF